MTYILYRRKNSDRYPILLRENSIINKGNKILIEAVHAFDEQYVLARKCAEYVYYAFKYNIENVRVKFNNSRDDSVNGAVIKIKNIISPLVNAQINGFDDNKWCLIEIGISKDILNCSDEEATLKIWEALVHELGHSNIYWKRISNKCNIDDAPDDYQKWLNVISSNKVGDKDIVYLFCYALYSTYYQEIQAFVSQIFSQVVINIHKKLGDNKDATKNITKQEFWNALVGTDVYQTYKNNIETSNYLLQSIDLRNALERELKNYAIYYNGPQIEKLCRMIIRKSKTALKNAYNNAYYYFYKNF